MLPTKDLAKQYFCHTYDLQIFNKTKVFRKWQKSRKFASVFKTFHLYILLCFEILSASAYQNIHSGAKTDVLVYAPFSCPISSSILE